METNQNFNEMNMYYVILIDFLRLFYYKFII